MAWYVLGVYPEAIGNSDLAVTILIGLFNCFFFVFFFCYYIMVTFHVSKDKKD